MAKRANLEGFGGLVFVEMDMEDGTAYYNLSRNKNIVHKGNTYEPVNGAFFISGLAEELDPTTSVQLILHPNFGGDSQQFVNNPVPPIPVRIRIVFTRNNSDAPSNRFTEELIHTGILTNGRNEAQGVTFDITPEELGLSEGSPEFYLPEDHERNYPTDKILRNRRNLAGKQRRAPS